jgi:hypothetical protein
MLTYGMKINRIGTCQFNWQLYLCTHVLRAAQTRLKTTPSIKKS